MSLFLNTELPEKYRERIEKRITYIVIGRCGWILPSVMVLLIVFMILVGATSVWGEDNRRFIILDVITLLNLGFLYYLYRKSYIEKAEDVGRSHVFIQNVTSCAVILWGALVTAFDINSTVGYSTFIVCLLLVGGLMYIKPGIIILMSAIGFGIMHTVRMMADLPFYTPDVIQEVMLFAAVLFLTLIVNRFNVSIILKSLILELELESKVEERTRQLKEETVRAQRADILKTAFLANMSHEIRTPLNGIIGFTNLLKTADIKPEEQKKYIDIVNKSGNLLLEILNDIIEVSRIESGSCEVSEEEFCLNDVFEEVLDSFRSHQKVSSGTLSLVNKAAAMPFTLMKSDRLKIVQILVNLVNNAIKYSEKGSVTAEFSPYPDKHIEIKIADTGKGIKSEDLELIFGRFHQIDLDPYRRTDGVGLGLTIVQGYMELLSGSISVESEPGKGTEFRLLFPAGID